MENLNKRPSKGILRFSEGASRSNSVEKDIKWDEANIKETLHPDDKDYGFMSIDEPPTPFSRSPHGPSGENSDNDEDLTAKTNDLLEKVSKKIKEPPITIENVEALLDETDLQAIETEDCEPLNGTNEVTFKADTSTSQKLSSNIEAENLRASCSSSSSGGASASEFELKRKRHYNEFHAVKLAKKLMQKEADEDEDDEDKDDEGNNHDVSKN